MRRRKKRMLLQRKLSAMLAVIMFVLQVPAAEVSAEAGEPELQREIVFYDGEIVDLVNETKRYSVIGAENYSENGRIPGTQAFTFDGKTAINLDTDEYVNKQEFTMETWVYLEPDANAGRFFSNSINTSYPNQWDWGYNTKSSGYGPYMIMSSSNCKGTASYSSEAVRITGEEYGSYPLGEWIHVALTRNGKEFAIYVNGQLAAAASAPSDLEQSNPNARALIGAQNAPNGTDVVLGMIGRMDSFKVYDGAKSLSQIRETYYEERYEEGLIREYLFDGSLKDYSGNDDHGTAVGQLAYEAGRMKGKQAVSFNGSSGVRIEPEIINEKYFTMETWVYLEPGNNAGRFFSNSRNASYPNQWDWGYNTAAANHAPYFIISSSSCVNAAAYENESVRMSKGQYPAGEWTHLVLVRDNQQFYIYVNGELMDSAAAPNELLQTTNTAPALIGAQTPSNGTGAMLGMQGLMDSFRIYNLAKTAEEIAADYQTEAAQSENSGSQAVNEAKERLKAVMNEAEAVEEEKYTDKSISKLKAILSYGEAVYLSDETTVEKIEAAISYIRSAMDALIPKGADNNWGDEEEWLEIQEILSNIKGISKEQEEWTSNIKIDVNSKKETSVLPNAQLLGNGDVGVVHDARDHTFTHYFSRTDFWSNSTHYGGGKLKYSSPDKAVGEEVFLQEQDILNAKVDSTLTMGGAVVRSESFMSDADDMLITKLWIEEFADGVKQLNLDLELSGYSSADSGFDQEEQIMYMTRSLPGTLQARLAASTKIIGAEAAYKKDTNKVTASIVLNEGNDKKNPIYILTAIHGEGAVQNLKPIDYHLETAKTAVEKVSVDEISGLYKKHQDWWKDYWLASYIDTGDSEINEFYYGQLYLLGIVYREDMSIPPGLYGSLQVMNESPWTGSYYLNYNFQAATYGAYSSNRGSLMYSYYNAMENMLWKHGKNYAASAGFQGIAAGWTGNPSWISMDMPEFKEVAANKNYSGIYSQRFIAAMILSEFVWNYDYTMDEEFYVDVTYPLLYELGEFYLDFVELESDGKYHMNHVSVNEYGNDKDGAVELGFCKYVLDTLIKYRDLVEVPDSKAAEWENVADNLYEFPTRVYDGMEMYVLAEEINNSLKGNALINIYDQPIVLEGMVHPADGLTMDSDSEELQRAVNYLNYAKAYYADNGNSSTYRGALGNGFVKTFTIMARLGWDADDLMHWFKNALNYNMRSSNLTATSNPSVGGVESAGALETVNNMLVQMTNDGEKDLLRVFPVWPEGTDAEFTRLRTQGAFLVTSEYDAESKTIPYVEILSEKGSTVHFVSPWGNKNISVVDEEGTMIETAHGLTANTGDLYFTFDTKEGKTYYITESKDSLTGGPESIKLTIERTTLTPGEQITAEAILPEGESEDYICWNTSDPLTAIVRQDGTIVAKAGGSCVITAESVLDASVKAEITIYVCQLEEPKKVNDKINNTDQSISYTGSWTSGTGRDGAYQNDAHYTSQAGSYCEFTFYGTGIAWVSETYTNLGTAEVWLDGSLVATPNLYSEGSAQRDKIVWSTEDLEYGRHTIKLVFVEKYLIVDAFVVSGQLDQTPLYDALAGISLLDEKDYDPEKWSQFMELWIEAAKKYAQFPEGFASQDEVNDLASEVLSAIEDLKKDPEAGSEVSKATLEYFLNCAKKHVADGDTEGLVESVQKLFDEAISEGESVMADENATKDEVTNAAVKLMKAIQALDFKAGDKTDLEMALELAQEIDLTKYVEAGQAEYLAAKETAENVMTDGDAMQSEVDEAWDALVDAMSGLRLKADKTALQELTSSLEGLDLSLYTEESVQIYSAAFARANVLLADETLSIDAQDEVDEAVKELTKAKEQLTLREENQGGSGDEQNPDSSTETAGEESQNPDDTAGTPDTENSGSNTQDQAEGNADRTAGDSQISGKSAGKAAKTGDHANPALWAAMLGAGAAIAGAASIKRKKYK